MAEQATPSPSIPSRRRALKIGAAAAAGTVVWTEPTIRGLARRPAYAAGGSGQEIVFDLGTALSPPNASSSSPPGVEIFQSGVATVVDAASGTTLQITRGGTVAGTNSTNDFTFAIRERPALLCGVVTYRRGRTRAIVVQTPPGLLNELTPVTVNPGIGGAAVFYLTGQITCKPI